jgi:hypothetical protein
MMDSCYRKLYCTQTKVQHCFLARVGQEFSLESEIRTEFPIQHTLDLDINCDTHHSGYKVAILTLEVHSQDPSQTLPTHAACFSPIGFRKVYPSLCPLTYRTEVEFHCYGMLQLLARSLDWESPHGNGICQ